MPRTKKQALGKTSINKFLFLRLSIYNNPKPSTTKKPAWNSIILECLKKARMPNLVKSFGYIKCYICQKIWWWTRTELDNSNTCIRYILQIINFTNCSTWLFFNKYTHENIFSVPWVHEATLRKLANMYFKTICTSDS